MPPLSSGLDFTPSTLGDSAAAFATDTTDALITIAGHRLEGAAGSVLDVSVHQQLGQAAQATVRLAAWDFDTQQLILVDDAMFAPGSSVEIELGYLDHRAPVFSGEIIGLEFESSSDQRPVLTIQAYDLLHRLGRGGRQQSYPESTCAGIVRTLVNDHYDNIAVEADDDPKADPVNPIVYQTGESDLEFLLGLAKSIHYELSAAPKGRTLIFRKSQIDAEPAVAPALRLDASQDVVQFSSRIDAAGQLGGVDVIGINSDTKQSIKVSVENKYSVDTHFGSVASRSVIARAVLPTQEEAAALARAELLRIQASYLHANGTCFGRTELRPGLVIAIDGLGDRFGGAYHVTGVTHTLTASAGYRTSFELEGRPR